MLLRAVEVDTTTCLIYQSPSGLSMRNRSIRYKLFAATRPNAGHIAGRVVQGVPVTLVTTGWYPVTAQEAADGPP